MQDPRVLSRAFLDAADAAAGVLARPEVAARWEDDSILAMFSVAALAGHLLRGITVVEQYLEGPVPDGQTVSGAEYFHVLGVSSDVGDPGNEAIRARGAQMAADGPSAVAAAAAAAASQMSSALPALDLDRRMRVVGDVVITLGEYLRTRVVELVVHGGDLTASVGIAAPSWRSETSGVAIDTLVDLARVRHGDGAVLLALARRERDTVEALRVL
jgi:hypothetical protein